MKQVFYVTSTKGFVLDFPLIQHKQQNNSINQFYSKKKKNKACYPRMINGALHTTLSMTLGKKKKNKTKLGQNEKNYAEQNTALIQESLKPARIFKTQNFCTEKNMT